MTKYQDTYRRTLLDMHVPDWDDAFLSQYDPDALAQRYADAGIEGILIYFKSHMGLNYWPAPVGKIHPVAADRDLAGEMVDACRRLGLAPAAYQSVIFDNWAAEEHPDWAQVASGTRFGGPDDGLLGPRYGLCCPNSPEYLAYEQEQIAGIVSTYDVDALWIDMVFYPKICVCIHCERRCMAELGHGIPTVVDWGDPRWAGFQEARTRWLNEFYRELRSTAHAQKPGIAVAHNLAPELLGWRVGAMTDEIVADDFAAGDLYGGRDEQLFVSKLMTSITRLRPAEYMTSRAPDLSFHTQLRSERELLIHALGATAHHLAFLFIDAIDPAGTTDPAVYERIRKVLDATRGYEKNLGGDPVADVGVYYSPRSRMSWRSNGAPADDLAVDPNPSDHEDAFRGACRALQHHHIPFGVVTPQTLDQLRRYDAVVLPNVTRMTDEEVEAVRSYVAGGGRVYASGVTSLTGTDGHRSTDFRLADVFGVHAAGMHDGYRAFVKPVANDLRSAIEPEPYLGWALSRQVMRKRAHEVPADIPRLGDMGDQAATLGTLTLPYAYPERGTLEDHRFASIHASPPWTDLDEPAMVRNSFERGRTVFSAFPIEAAEDHTSRRTFAELVAGLVGEPGRLRVVGPSQVWATLYDQPDNDRMILSLLNYDLGYEEGVLARVDVVAIAPDGHRIRSVRRTGADVADEAIIGDDGASVRLEGLVLETFAQYVVDLEVAD